MNPWFTQLNLIKGKGFLDYLWHAYGLAVYNIS